MTTELRIPRIVLATGGSWKAVKDLFMVNVMKVRTLAGKLSHVKRENVPTQCLRAEQYQGEQFFIP